MLEMLAVGAAGDPATWIVVTALAAGLVCVWIGLRAAARAAAASEAAERRALQERARAEAAESELRAARERAESDVRGEQPVLEALPRALRELAGSTSRNDLAVALGRAIERGIGPRHWMVFTAADDTGQEFVLAASSAVDGSAWPPGARISHQTGRVGLAVRRKQPLDARDLEAEPPLVREQVDATEPASFVVDVAVPIVAGDRVVAVVTAGGLRQSLAVGRAALQCIAEHAVVVLRGLDARERAHRFANQDALTGLGNRMWFANHGGEAIYRARNTGGAAALLLFRVRDFDVYQRLHGHAAADRLLRGVASVLRPICREKDVLARYGEEEFAALLVGLDGDVARDVAARVRATVASVDWPHAEDQPGGRVTLDVGVAALAEAGESLDELLDAARAAWNAPLESS